ncbi:MAG: TonB-dependent receptor [Balneolaceae bacterium]|nr:MAG: TonB-dependent receptor [Balneolaceae bacterium]
MKKYTKLAVVLLLFGLGVTESHAISTNETLRGEVTDATTGEAIPGATVFIEELERGIAADNEGRFDFGIISSGTYTLTVRSVGFTVKKMTIDHPANGLIRIELQPSIMQADDIIVTSSPIGKNIQYQPAQAFNAEMLQQKAAPSLGEMLDGTPGVTTRSFGSAPARPVIRGFDGDRVLVMQNGERMGDLSGTAVDHAVALDPLSMDRVEVVRGPASLLYGSSAIGGVVNMFSNDMPREWENGTKGSVASHVATVNNMGAGLVRAQYGSNNFAATGRVIYRNGGDLMTPEGRLPDTAINNFSYGSGLGYRSGPFETGLAISGMDYTYGLPEAIDDLNESIEIRMNRTNIQSISTLKMDRFFDHAELRIHYSDYAHDEIEIERLQDGGIEEELEIRFDQQTISSSLVLRHRQLGALEGALGLSFNRSQIAVGGAEALTPDAEGYFLTGYIYEEISLSDLITLKTGMRIEWKETFVKTNELFPDASAFEDRSDLIFSGALGLNYSPSARWTAGFQVARAYRTPTIEELYSFAPHAAAGSFDIGNPTLQNEFSIGTDAFVEYQTDRFQTQLSLFANRIDNFVDFTPTGEIHQPSGLPFFEYVSKDAILYGFELSTNVAFSDVLSGGIGFDYVRGRERSGELRNLTFMPPFRTHLQFMYDNGTIWAGPRLRIVNRQEQVAPNEDPTPGYLLIGADAGYRFGHGVTLSLRLDNLLNERYRDHLSRIENRDAPMPGRNFNAMVRWEF